MALLEEVHYQREIVVSKASHHSHVFLLLPILWLLAAASVFCHPLPTPIIPLFL